MSVDLIKNKAEHSSSETFHSDSKAQSKATIDEALSGFRHQLIAVLAILPAIQSSGFLVYMFGYLT